MTGVMMALAGGATQPTISVTLDDYASSWAFIDPFYQGDTTVTATPSGGSSYTYSWEVVSGPGFPTNPTGASSDFFSEYNSATVVRCIVTDTPTGAVGYSPNHTIS